jgi:hypothetical protein
MKGRRGDEETERLRDEGTKRQNIKNERINLGCKEGR